MGYFFGGIIMEKKILLLAVVVMVVGLCASSALALDPMGPPVAGLKEGQFSAGLDYAFSDTDMDFDGEFEMFLDDYSFFDPITDKLTFEAVEMHKAYLTIGYGVAENVEAFVRFGGARAETRKPDRYSEQDLYSEYYGSEPAGYFEMWEDGQAHDFDSGFAFGFGAKATLYEEGPLKIGVLGQASWTELDVRTRYHGYSEIDSYVGSYEGEWSYPAEGELEIWEVQVALGATYDLSPGFKIYGGPFFYWLDGDYSFNGEGYFAEEEELWNDYEGEYYLAVVDWWNLCVDGDYDVENDSEFGGYLGAQIEVTDNVICNAECIFTGDGIGVGTGLAWRF
jgi:opacity protein-like surface antigen